MPRLTDAEITRIVDEMEAAEAAAAELARLVAKLTPRQVEVARGLGVSLESYALRVQEARRG